MKPSTPSWQAALTCLLLLLLSSCGSDKTETRNQADSDPQLVGGWRNETSYSSGDSGAGKILKGRWSAANKRLFIIWQSGSEEEFTYYRESNSMLLTPLGGGKKQLWEKVR